MFPVPREFTNVAEMRTKYRDARERLWPKAVLPPAPPPAPEPLPIELRPEPERDPEPETLPPIASPAAMAEFLETWRPAPAVKIRAMVAKHFRITRAEIIGASRKSVYIRARHIAMDLCVRYAGTSRPQTGRLFGNRDHTTVLHAEDNVRRWTADDPHVAALIAEFVRQIEEWSAEPQAETGA